MFLPDVSSLVMIPRLEIRHRPPLKRRTAAVRIASLAVLAFALAASAGCGRHAQQGSADPAPQPQIKPAPPTPIAVKKVELGQGDPWNPAWDVMIEKALPR